MNAKDNIQKLGAPAPITIVSTLLLNKGIQQHNWRETIASILGVHYTTAKRLLADEERFELGHLVAIAAHFKISLNELLSQLLLPKIGSDTKEAVLRIENVVSKPCRFSTYKDNIIDSNPALVAYIENDRYVVTTPDKCPESLSPVAVENLYLGLQSGNLDLSPHVIVLDDVAPLMLVHHLRSKGFNAEAFKNPKDLEELILSGKKLPDAFVLDWALGRSTNALPVIQAVRSISEHCPLILLTGTIDKYEGAICDAVEKYNLEIHLKPSKASIISSRLAVLLRTEANQTSPVEVTYNDLQRRTPGTPTE